MVRDVRVAIPKAAILNNKKKRKNRTSEFIHFSIVVINSEIYFIQIYQKSSKNLYKNLSSNL